MLFHEVPPFDTLSSQASPYEGFGTLVNSPETEGRFSEVVKLARERILDVFEAELGDADNAAPEIERIIDRMWGEGWEPHNADVNLFATDFGSVLTNALQLCLGGKVIFRSATDLSHTSIWWKNAGVETFPFHKTYKRLLEREAESIAFYERSLRRLVK